MKASELWAHYVKRNPHWATGNVTLTPEGLEKLVKATHRQGFVAGQKSAEAVKTHKDRDKTPGFGGRGNPFEDAIRRARDGLY